MKKRILSALMALALALSLMPTAALAQGESSGEDENAPVAEVGGVQYTPAQFMDAIAAAAAAPGSTVKLLRDYTMDLGDQSLDLSGYRLIFDLGGKTLTINTTNAIAVKMLSNEDPGTEITVKNGTLAGTAGTYLIRAANTGKLTMENMTVHYNGSGAKAIYTGLSQGAELSDVEIEAPNSGCVEVTSNATFTNCTFTAKNTADGATDAYLYTAIAVSTGGEATVNSGTYKGLYALYVYNSGGSIDVKDGIFEGTTAALQSDTSASAFDNSLITVSGGSFTGQIQTGGSGGSYTNEIEISGGSYTVDPSDYLADDCQIKNDGQGGFDVEPAPAALITVLDTFQQPAGTANTLKEALEKINGNGTLIFQGNVEISEDIVIPSMCTIRLNGYDLTGDSAVTVNQSGLTIEGSGEVACNLNNSTTNAYNLLLNGGSYSGTINGPAQVNSGDVKFSADTYTSADDSLVMPSGYEAKEKNGWYAFEPITYKVTLNPMGGTISETFLEGSGWTVDQDSGIAELSHTYDPDTSVSVPNAEQITGPGDTVLSAWYSTEDYTGGTTVNSTSGKLSNYNLTSKAAEDHTLTLYAKWKAAPIVAYVCDGDTRVKGYSSLEKAVVAAQPGQTVEVFNNVTLQESLTIDKDITLDLGNKGISFETYKSLILKANVTILGDSPEKKGYIQSVSASAIQALTDGTAITMKNVNVGTQGSVAMQLGTGGNKNVKVDLTAENCKFQLSDSSNHMQSNGGLRVQSGGTVKLTNCEFINGDSKQGYALRIDNGPDSTVTIDDCLIDANTTGKTSGFYGYALNISGDSGNDMAGKVTVSNSTIQVRKYQGSAVYLQNVSASADVTLGEGNTVTGPVKLVTYNQPNYRLKITDGKFDNNHAAPFLNSASTRPAEELKARLYVTGGYYQVNVKDFTAPGYLCGSSSGEDGYSYQVTIDPSAGGFYTESGGQKTFYQDMETAVTAKAGTVYVCQDYALTADDLTLLNENAVILATDTATITYDGSLKELLTAIPNAALADASLKTNDAALSDVYSSDGKLTGGTGSKTDVAACSGLLMEGYLIDASTGAVNDRYSIVQQDNTFVAKIGDMGYQGLDEAVTAATSYDQSAQTKEEITLLQNWDREVFVTQPHSAFTLNLNGKTITGGVSITAADSGLGTSTKADHADITLKNGFITVENGFGVHTNGQLTDVKLTLEDLTVTVAEGAAAYLAAGGNTAITGGSYTGEMGVQVCAGSLIIDGAAVTATAQVSGDLSQAGSGLIPDGSAVSVVQRDGYEAVGTVTISSGTFTAASGMESLKAYSWDGSEESDWTDAAENVKVNGGTYSSSVLEFAEKPFEVKGESGYSYYPTAQDAINAAQAGGGVIAAGDGETVPAPAQDGVSIIAAPGTNVEAPAGYYLTQTTGADGNITYTVHKNTEEEKPDQKPGTGSSGGGSYDSEPSYSPVQNVSEGGTIKVSPRTAEEGDEVTITPNPDAGYEVADVTVTRNGREIDVTENRDGTWTFTQPGGRVTIDVTFQRIGGKPVGFTDVPAGFWAADEINWAYENGYVNGTGATTFNPNGAISRQQIWMILARLSGYQPEDMAAARAWAMSNGISDGTNPGAAVTRQQLVALLFRFAEDLGYANDRRADLSVYPDASAVAAYAVEPMQWSVANDVVGGTTQGTLNPTGTATRAQLAVILYRFWANL